MQNRLIIDINIMFSGHLYCNVNVSAASHNVFNVSCRSSLGKPWQFPSFCWKEAGGFWVEEVLCALIWLSNAQIRHVDRKQVTSFAYNCVCTHVSCCFYVTHVPPTSMWLLLSVLHVWWWLFLDVLLEAWSSWLATTISVKWVCAIIQHQALIALVLMTFLFLKSES